MSAARWWRGRRLGLLFVLCIAIARAEPLRPKAPNWSGLTESSVLLTWKRPGAAGAEPLAHAYELQRRDAVGASWWTIYEGPAFSFRDISLAPQTTYKYRVRARNANGPSQHSDSTTVHCRAVGAAAAHARGDVNSADDNADGFLDQSELRDLIEEELAGSSASTINAKLQTAMSNVDGNVDGLLTAEELDQYRHKLGSILTVDEVADWVANAVQLPQYARTFKENAISGYEFRALLENQGSMLGEELGVENRLHRRQIMRAMSMRLFGIGAVPGRPASPKWSDPSEDGGTVAWEAPATDGTPVHSYRLQRNDGIGAAWVTVYEGPALSIRETGLRAHVTYQFRVQAWNMYGHSDYSPSVAAHCRATSAAAQAVGDVRSADENADGVLDRTELRELIEGELGSANVEVEQQVKSALRNVDRNVDGLLTPEELDSYRQQLGSTLSVEEVMDWVTHAVQLPQYAHAFRENAIVGHDFRGLLENGGELLREELGIESRLHRRQIMRAMSLQLYGMGSRPAVPPRPSAQLNGAFEVVVTWRPADVEQSPHVHKFRVQRRDSKHGAWHTVYDGPARSMVDVVDAQSRGKCEYRVQAWNMIGGSHFSPSTSCTSSSLADWVGVIGSVVMSLLVVWQVPSVKHAANMFALRVWAAYKDMPFPASPRPAAVPKYFRSLAPAASRVAGLPFSMWRTTTAHEPHTSDSGCAPDDAQDSAPAEHARSHWRMLHDHLRSSDKAVSLAARLRQLASPITPSNSVPEALNKLCDGGEADALHVTRAKSMGGRGPRLSYGTPAASRQNSSPVQQRPCAPTAAPAEEPPAVRHAPNWGSVSDWVVHAAAATLKSWDSVVSFTKPRTLAHLDDDDINDIDRCYLCHKSVGSIFRIRHICRVCRRIFCHECGCTPHPFPSVICGDGCICRHHLGGANAAGNGKGHRAASTIRSSDG